MFEIYSFHLNLPEEGGLVFDLPSPKQILTTKLLARWQQLLQLLRADAQVAGQMNELIKLTAQGE